MKTLQVFLYSLLALLAAAYSALSAEPASKSYLNAVSVSPYYTVAFQNFDGAAREGGGLELALPLSKTISLVAHGESDSTQGAAIDRSGIGLEVKGKLGALRPFGRMSFGYAWDAASSVDETAFYLRPQFGATLPFYTKGNFEAGLTASWALDVSMDGETAQRLFGGLGFSFKF